MIKTFKKDYTDEVMKIWLETNINTHNFIPKSYWKDNFDNVKNTLSDANIYIYYNNNSIQGFIGLIDEYIAGIFVDCKFQSKGIGKELLDYVKQNKEKLLLKVYAKNKLAIKFYEREKFVIENKKIDIVTGEEEILMVWKK